MATTTVLSIDPGLTTGYCFATVTGINIALKPYQKMHNVVEFYEEVRLGSPNYIVCEDFLYRKGQRDKLILYSVQLIGVVQLYRHWYGIPVYMQSPAKGKAFYSNEQLKRLGAYKRGMLHAMDATRHLMHWFTFGAGFKLVDPDAATIKLV